MQVPVNKMLVTMPVIKKTIPITNPISEYTQAQAPDTQSDIYRLKLKNNTKCLKNFKHTRALQSSEEGEREGRRIKNLKSSISCTKFCTKEPFHISLFTIHVN